MPKWKTDKITPETGDQIIYQGELFDYLRTERQSNGSVTGDVYILRSRRYKLTYHPLKFANDMAGGKIKWVKRMPAQ